MVRRDRPNRPNCPSGVQVQPLSADLPPSGLSIDDPPLRFPAQFLDGRAEMVLCPLSGRDDSTDTPMFDRPVHGGEIAGRYVHGRKRLTVPESAHQPETMLNL